MTSHNEANVVAGENLYEFFSLGCRFCYCNLEEVVYGFDKTLRLLQNPPIQNLRDEILLKVLRASFSLRPWENTEERLKELNDKYLPLMKMKIPS